VNTIANYERKGKLRPIYVYRPDSRNVQHRVAVYDPDELLRLPHPLTQQPPNQEPGELAANCFELLGKGKTVAEIVIELRVTPDQVNALRESWLDSGGTDLIITPTAKKTFEKLIGATFTNISDLLDLVTRALSTNRSSETQ
jgi:hypothetical protein